MSALDAAASHHDGSSRHRHDEKTPVRAALVAGSTPVSPSPAAGAPPPPLLRLPSQQGLVSIYPHQVGGHGIGERDGGFLRLGATVLKPVQKDLRGDNEKNFFLVRHGALDTARPHT